jgi:hypothetical protein
MLEDGVEIVWRFHGDCVKMLGRGQPLANQPHNGFDGSGDSR